MSLPVPQALLITNIRQARLHVAARELALANDFIRQSLRSVDDASSFKWPPPTLHVARSCIAKAGRAILKSNFELAAMALDDAIRVLRQPME